MKKNCKYWQRMIFFLGLMSFFSSILIPLERNSFDISVCEVSFIDQCRLMIDLTNQGGGLDKNFPQKSIDRVVLRIQRDGRLWKDVPLSEVDPAGQLFKKSGSLTYFWDPFAEGEKREMLNSPFTVDVVFDPRNRLKDENFDNNTLSREVFCQHYFNIRPCKIRLDSVSHTVVYYGHKIFLSGDFGKSRGKRMVAIKSLGKGKGRGKNKIFHAFVLKWTEREITVKIPDNIPRGFCRIGIFCGPNSPYHTRWFPIRLTGTGRRIYRND